MVLYGSGPSTGTPYTRQNKKSRFIFHGNALALRLARCNIRNRNKGNTTLQTSKSIWQPRPVISIRVRAYLTEIPNICSTCHLLCFESMHFSHTPNHFVQTKFWHNDKQTYPNVDLSLSKSCQARPCQSSRRKCRFHGKNNMNQQERGDVPCFFCSLSVSAALVKRPDSNHWLWIQIISLMFVYMFVDCISSQRYGSGHARHGIFPARPWASHKKYSMQNYVFSLFLFGFLGVFFQFYFVFWSISPNFGLQFVHIYFLSFVLLDLLVFLKYKMY